MPPKTVQDRFYKDPEWYQVEDLILEFINPLLDMTSVNTNQPAEAVKAEIIGRRLAYDSLIKFVRGSKMLNRELPDNKNLFR